MPLKPLFEGNGDKDEMKGIGHVLLQQIVAVAKDIVIHKLRTSDASWAIHEQLELTSSKN